jgi:hypothetical protein
MIKPNQRPSDMPNGRRCLPRVLVIAMFGVVTMHAMPGP